MGPNFFGGMKLDGIDWGWEVMQLTPCANYVGFLYNVFGALNSWSSKHANHEKMLGMYKI